MVPSTVAGHGADGSSAEPSCVEVKGKEAQR